MPQTMLRSLFMKATTKHSLHLAQCNPQRRMHTRNKTAMELIAKWWSALKEVDRVIDYCELNDKCLIPLLRVYGVKILVSNVNGVSLFLSLSREAFDGGSLSKQMQTAKDNFELALEADNSNTHARYWLSKLHLKYHVPGACKAIMNMFNQINKLFIIWRRRLTRCSISSRSCIFDRGLCEERYYLAVWCFHRASEKGHAGAAIAYGSLLLRGVQVPECLTKFNAKRDSATRTSRNNAGSPKKNPLEMTREQFEIAAKAESDFGFRWLKRLDEEEKRLLNPLFANYL